MVTVATSELVQRLGLGQEAGTGTALTTLNGGTAALPSVAGGLEVTLAAGTPHEHTARVACLVTPTSPGCDLILGNDWLGTVYRGSVDLGGGFVGCRAPTQQADDPNFAWRLPILPVSRIPVQLQAYLQGLHELRAAVPSGGSAAVAEEHEGTEPPDKESGGQPQ